MAKMTKMIHVQAIGCLGIPSSAYAPILDRLKKLGVNSVGFTDIQSIPHKQNWKLSIEKVLNDAEEIKSKMAGKNDKFIGFGHSIGGALFYGAAVLAKKKQKQLQFDGDESYKPIDKLVLYEPPLMSPYKRMGMGLMGITGTFNKFPAVKATFKRKYSFVNKEEAIEYLNSKTFYKKFHPEMLESFIKETLIEDENGKVIMKFTPQEEADYIMSSPIDLNPLKDKYMYSSDSICDGKAYYNLNYDFAKPNDIKYQSKTLCGPNGHYSYESIEKSSHYYPLHNPDRFAELIYQNISEELKIQ